MYAGERCAWILLSVCICALPMTTAQTQDTSDLLSKELLNRTSQLAKAKFIPLRDQNDTVVLQMGIALRQIIELTERRQVLTTAVWMRQYWTDPFLSWDPEKYNGTTEVYLPYNVIWTPDIFLYNSVDAQVAAMYEEIITNVNYDGRITFLYPAVLKTSCPIDDHAFPFDEQVCVLKFGSWAYNGYKLDIELKPNNPADLGNYQYNSEWGIVNMTAEKHVFVYGCCPEPYPDVRFYIRMRRRWVMLFFYLVFPNMFINIFGMLQFLLPPDSTERITLGTTTFLAMIVYLLLLIDMLPITQSVPFIAQYIGGTLALIATSTLTSIGILQIHFQGNHDNNSQVPEWVRTLFLHKLCRYLGLKKYITPDEEHENKLAVFQSNIILETGESDEDLTSEHELNTKLGHTTNMPSVETCNLQAGQRRRSVQNRRMSLRITKTGENQEFILGRILSQIESFKSEATENDRERELQCEWQEVAMVLDRLMLYIYIVSTAILLIYCACRVPRYNEPIYI